MTILLDEERPVINTEVELWWMGYALTAPADFDLMEHTSWMEINPWPEYEFNGIPNYNWPLDFTDELFGRRKED